MISHMVFFTQPAWFSRVHGSFVRTQTLRFIRHIINRLNWLKRWRSVPSFCSQVAINMLKRTPARRTAVFSKLQITEWFPFMLSPPMPSSVVKFCRERFLNVRHFFTGMCLQALPDPSASLSVDASIAPMLSGNWLFLPLRCLFSSLHHLPSVPGSYWLALEKHSMWPACIHTLMHMHTCMHFLYGGTYLYYERQISIKCSFWKMSSAVSIIMPIVSSQWSINHSGKMLPANFEGLTFNLTRRCQEQLLFPYKKSCVNIVKFLLLATKKKNNSVLAGTLLRKARQKRD